MSIEKLGTELRKRYGLGPTTHGKQFIELNLYCDFEGHGIASEVWEMHWRLTLPLERWGDLPVHFHGDTSDSVILQALDFIRTEKYANLSNL